MLGESYNIDIMRMRVSDHRPPGDSIAFKCGPGALFARTIHKCKFLNRDIFLTGTIFRSRLPSLAFYIVVL